MSSKFWLNFCECVVKISIFAHTIDSIYKMLFLDIMNVFTSSFHFFTVYWNNVESRELVELIIVIIWLLFTILEFIFLILTLVIYIPLRLIVYILMAFGKDPRTFLVCIVLFFFYIIAYWSISTQGYDAFIESDKSVKMIVALVIIVGIIYYLTS